MLMQKEKEKAQYLFVQKNDTKTINNSNLANKQNLNNNVHTILYKKGKNKGN